jgi:hypothetical protein
MALDMAADTLIVHGVEYDATPIKVENFSAGNGEINYRFNNQRRKGPVNEIVVHETVTRSSLSTVKVLEPKTAANPGGRGLGVHFIIDPDGTAYQHGDLSDDLLWHATMHNPVSVGIETVSPYQPNLMPKDGPWSQVIAAPWAVGGKYVVPTKEQSETVSNLLWWMTDPCAAPELTIPQTWIGLKGGTMSLGRVAGADKLSPGIYAHTYFDHGDGSWLVLYSWLRLVAGLSQEDAYAEAVRRATGVRNADVSDLIPAAAAT